jgi:hypothetical protein
MRRAGGTRRSPDRTEEAMRGTLEPGTRPAPSGGPQAWGPRLGEHVAALVAAAVTFVALGFLILLRYPLRDYVYPIGWDSATYVWRAGAVTVDGLARIGAIRAGSPLLVGLMMQATGQNGFTMVPIVMAVLAGIVALGNAAMARAAFGVRAIWIPVIGVTSWLGFGHIGMIGGHLDNVLNAAFVVGAFASAIALAGRGRGALGVALLFMAAAVAEWPFYLLALAVFFLALGIFAWPALRSRGSRPDLLKPAGRLALAAGASAVLAGLTFLARPPGGGVGLRSFGARFRATIRDRFFQRLRDPARFYAVPLAAAGAFLGARAPVAADRGPARRLFLSLMASWVVVTLAASIAQVAGIPVAGARLLNYFFAVPILTGVLLWALTQALIGRWRAVGAAVGVAMVAAAFIGFGALAWQGEDGRKPWIAPDAVAQIAAAGRYAERSAPGRSLYFIGAGGELAWNVIQAALPPNLVPRAVRYEGTPEQFMASVGDIQGQSIASGGQGAIGIVIQRYNRPGYKDAVGTNQWARVAPGVLVLPGAAPVPRLHIAPPKGNLRARSLLWIPAAVIVLLFVAGAGWAMALLPPDPVLRVALAPGFGAGMLTLLALGWDRVGLGFSRSNTWMVVAATTLLGWVTAALMARRGSSPPALSPGRRPARPEGANGA